MTKVDNLNKWLTLVANIGVLVGIFFLALEIQQNTAANRAGSRQLVSDQLISTLALQIDTSVLAIARSKMLQGLPLEFLEQDQLNVHSSLWWHTINNAYYQNKMDQLETSEWQGIIRNIIAVFADDSPSWVQLRKHWAWVQHGMAPEFVTYVESVRKNAEATGS